MPILNLTLTPDGAIIDILVGVSVPRRQALIAAGATVPRPIAIRALVDSGASCTSIDVSAIQPLGLPPIGTVPVNTSTTGKSPVSCFVYDVSLVIVHPARGKSFSTIPVLECQALSGNFQALLGRDLLEHCSFFYNGLERTFSLAF